MTPQDMRIAIAEARGFRKVSEIFYDLNKRTKWASPRLYFRSPDSGYGNKLFPNQQWGWAQPADWAGVTPDWGGVPDYLNDLNAMHGALKMLNDEQIMSYRDTLMAVANGFDTLDAFHNYLDGHPNEWHAFAAQECEASYKAKAFLITIGKYTP